VALLAFKDRHGAFEPIAGVEHALDSLTVLPPKFDLVEVPIVGWVGHNPPEAYCIPAPEIKKAK
jgi:hypothetical protein